MRPVSTEGCLLVVLPGPEQRRVAVRISDAELIGTVRAYAHAACMLLEGGASCSCSSSMHPGWPWNRAAAGAREPLEEAIKGEELGRAEERHCD